MKMRYLSDEYPSLYVFVLEHLKMSDKIQQYMAECKAYEHNPAKYSLYFHGYLLNWFN